MADELTIVSADLTDIRKGPPSVETGESATIANLVVTVRNESPTQTLHVSKLLGGYEYDADARELSLTLREPDTVLTLRTSPFKPPLQEAILPGQTKVLNFTIPLSARFISGFGKSSVGIRHSDASQVVRVKLSAAFSTAPLRAATPGSTTKPSIAVHVLEVRRSRQTTAD